MKKITTLISLLFISMVSFADTIPVIPIKAALDSALHVAGEIIHAIPGADATPYDWALWVALSFSIVFNLLQYFKVFVKKPAKTEGNESSEQQ